jgi:hypothetical protein
MYIIEAGRRALQDNSSSISSSKRPGSPSNSPQDWCPVLPAARDVLPAVLVHTQGVSKAVEWLQQQKQPTSSETQLVSLKAKSKGAAATPSTAAPAERNAQQLSVTAMNGFLEAALQVAGAVNESGDSSRAVALAKEAVQAANELFNFPLAAAQLAAAGAQRKEVSIPLQEVTV